MHDIIKSNKKTDPKDKIAVEKASNIEPLKVLIDI